MTVANPFKPAVRAMARARIGITGPAGAGKTFTALRLAHQLGKRIAVGDAERGSAALYVGEQADGLAFAYDIAPITDTSPRGYIACVRAAEAAGYDVLILDGITPEWDWCKEEVDRVKVRFGGNAWSAWSIVTPKHREFVDAILEARLHVIATIRTKTAWETAKDESGKSKPQKIGTAPETRENMDYEFSIVLNMQPGALAHVGKTRCRALTDTSWREPGADLAAIIRSWLTNDNDGAGAPATPAREQPSPAPAQPAPAPSESLASTKRAPAASDARNGSAAGAALEWGNAISLALVAAGIPPVSRGQFARDLNLPTPVQATREHYEHVRAELSSRGLLALAVAAPGMPAAEDDPASDDEGDEGDPFGAPEPKEEPCAGNEFAPAAPAAAPPASGPSTSAKTAGASTAPVTTSATERPAAPTTPTPTAPGVWTAEERRGLPEMAAAVRAHAELAPRILEGPPDSIAGANILGLLDGLCGSRRQTDAAGVLGHAVATRRDAALVVEALSAAPAPAPETASTTTRVADAWREVVREAGRTCGIPDGAVVRLVGEAGKDGQAPHTTWDRIRAVGSQRASPAALTEACRAAGVSVGADVVPAARALDVVVALASAIKRRVANAPATTSARAGS